MPIRPNPNGVLCTSLLLLLATLAVVATAADHPDKMPMKKHVLHADAHGNHDSLGMGNDHQYPSDDGMQFANEKDPQQTSQEHHHASFPAHESHELGRRLSLGDLVGLVFHLGDAIDDFRAAHTTITVTPGRAKNDSKPANASAPVPSIHMSTLGPELKPSAAAKNSSNSTQAPAAGFPTPEIYLKKALHQTPVTASAAPVASPSPAA